MKHLIYLLLLCMPVLSCVKHISTYDKKVRQYKKETYAEAGASRAVGSLWSEGSNNLFEDARARRVGDILTILLQERADATRDASTNTAKSSSVDFGISNFWTTMASFVASHPNLDSNALIAAATNNTFQGGGNTKRSGQLDAVLPVRIKETLPNGDFYVEGSKVLLLNDEESFLYISGVVRPIDIDPDNSVKSSMLADVELEYTGRGVITDNESPGWMLGILNYIWPF